MNKRVIFLFFVMSVNFVVAGNNISKLPVKAWLNVLNPRLDGKLGQKVKVVLKNARAYILIPLIKRIEKFVILKSLKISVPIVVATISVKKLINYYKSK